MAKLIMTENTCMKFYDETQPVYLEIDPSGTGLRPACPTTNQKCNKLPIRQHTRQQHTQTYCIYKQKPVTCGKNVQQH